MINLDEVFDEVYSALDELKAYIYEAAEKGAADFEKMDVMLNKIECRVSDAHRIAVG